VFFVIHAAPGDPLNQYTDPDLDAAQRAAIARSLGLDRSVVEQYLSWLGAAILHGDLGRSLHWHRSVTGILAEAIPNTLLLTVSAYLIYLLLGVGGGLLLARYRGHPLERAATVAGLTVYSLPTFWLGLMMILLFCRQLGWFPASGMHAPDAVFLSALRRFLDLLHHLVLPAVLLGVGSAMGTARYLSHSLAEVLGQDYILAARAKGLPERVVLGRHALRNALLPVITLVGLSFPFLLGGSVVAEVIFAWPGMGRVAVEAIFARDYPVIMGTTALSATMVVIGNLVADLLYALADPRVRLGGRRAV
jgi:peptide/nickel transport system permease protein